MAKQNSCKIRVNSKFMSDDGRTVDVPILLSDKIYQVRIQADSNDDDEHDNGVSISKSDKYQNKDWGSPCYISFDHDISLDEKREYDTWEITDRNKTVVPQKLSIREIRNGHNALDSLRDKSRHDRIYAKIPSDWVGSNGAYFVFKTGNDQNETFTMRNISTMNIEMRPHKNQNNQITSYDVSFDDIDSVVRMRAGTQGNKRDGKTNRQIYGTVRQAIGKTNIEYRVEKAETITLFMSSNHYWSPSDERSRAVYLPLRRDISYQNDNMKYYQNNKFFHIEEISSDTTALRIEPKNMSFRQDDRCLNMDPYGQTGTMELTLSLTKSEWQFFQTYVDFDRMNALLQREGYQGRTVIDVQKTSDMFSQPESSELYRPLNSKPAYEADSSDKIRFRRYDKLDINKYLDIDTQKGRVDKKNSIILSKYAEDYNRLVDFSNEHKLQINGIEPGMRVYEQDAMSELINAVKSDRDVMYLQCKAWADEHDINTTSIDIEDDSVMYKKLRDTYDSKNSSLNSTPQDITNEFNKMRGLSIDENKIFEYNGKKFKPYLIGYALSDRECKQLADGETIILSEVANNDNTRLYNYKVSLKAGKDLIDKSASHYIHIDSSFPTGLDTMDSFRNEDINEKYRLQADMFDEVFYHMAKQVMHADNKYAQSVENEIADDVSKWLDQITNNAKKSVTKAERAARSSRDEAVTGETKYNRYYFIEEWICSKKNSDGTSTTFRQKRSYDKLKATYDELSKLKPVDQSGIFENRYMEERWHADCKAALRKKMESDHAVNESLHKEISEKNDVLPRALQNGRTLFVHEYDRITEKVDSKLRPSKAWLDDYKNRFSNGMSASDDRNDKKNLISIS